MPQRLEFEPTMAAALARIDAIQPTSYARTRNHLDGAVTRLAPYLTHGFVQVPQVIDRLSQRCQLAPQDKTVFELAWRDYNAENVERYAPQWSSLGTVLDTGYDALEQLARLGGVADAPVGAGECANGQGDRLDRAGFP